MLPVVIGGAVLVVGVLAWLSVGKNQARQDLEHSQTRLNNAIKKMSCEIRQARQWVNDSKNFEHHIALYQASVALSKSHYKDYALYKELVAIIKAKRDEFTTKIGELKQLKQMLIGQACQAVSAELNQYYIWLDEVKAELARLHDKKAELLAQIRQINHNTHAIKCILRDKCGHGGRVWYERRFGND